MTPITRIVLGILVLTMIRAAFAQNPASITAPANGRPVAYDTGGGLDPADGEIILDQLCVMNHSFEIANGDTCGGSSIFGFDYDLQTAEDFELKEPATLTGVVCDYLLITGEFAATVCVSVYAGDCDFAEEMPLCYVEVEPYDVIVLPDPHYDNIFNRYIVKQELCDLGPGRYYISVNPRLTNDWAYSVGSYRNDGCGDFTCDVLLRDGEGDNPCCNGQSGYGYPDWTPSRDYWGWNTVISCQVQARFADTPMCIYTVTKAKPKAGWCGPACDVCSYSRGDLMCANTCLNGAGECAGTLTGISACANGSVCKVIADFTACDAAPGNCRHCR